MQTAAAGAGPVCNIKSVKLSTNEASTSQPIIKIGIDIVQKTGIDMEDEALPRSGQNDGDTNIAPPALSRIKYWRIRAPVIVPAPNNSDAWEYMVDISM